ncbi:hypothetical protein [Deinococcus hopiensis]|uniref:Uncharacterized protein n=1 Tax=Deinococcus hopiensis KR-140 TaxID=695939 RepID=A0A1W1UU52_9DEIO|nr:hypothetical protein [Deinococcus hopiensis]SMB84627.1 hypothetical protein SAMN00790413_05219 [Deinococcus hopiensis KR-140]
MSTLVLKGQWQGEVNSADRHFCGVVHESGEASVVAGTQVKVTFTGGTHRQEHSTDFHGQYILDGLEPSRFVLTSFIRKDRDAGQRGEQSGNEVQLWGGELYSTP